MRIAAALLGVITALSVSIAVAADPIPANRPNVVIFLADDAGCGDYGAAGNRLAQTPHIDSLAKNGVSLSRFFVQPVCSPTRAEFLTGRYHIRSGVTGTSSGRERLNLDERTIAEAFKKAGYATGAFGKWHNGSQWPYHPQARGFDEYFGHTAGHWGEYFDAPLEENGKMVRTKGYIVDVCTERAIDFIERNQARPFFCYVPFTTPHAPWAAPAKDWERFRDQPIEQTATDAKQEVADETRCALAMLANQDENVGRVLQKLDELKLADNTIVVYFSDNGPSSFRWTGGLKGRKGMTDEGGVRSVCYWRWPGHFAKGQVIDKISGAIDLLPTLVSLAGISRVGEKPLDGLDLSPLLTGAKHDWPERMIFNSWGGKTSVRTQTHRLDSASQLFDMRSDPGQTTPLNAAQPELAANLKRAGEKWFHEGYKPVSTDWPTETVAVDRRAIPVGYREFPITMLPARDGMPRGEVKRSAAAPNCSYFVNWRSKQDSIAWYVDVHTAGKYEVTIDYTCPEADAGSTVELAFADQKMIGRVVPGWDPPLYTNQDTIARPANISQMKEFRTLNLGTIELPVKDGLLTLRATDTPGKSVLDLRRVTLTLLDEKAAKQPATEARANVKTTKRPNIIFVMADDMGWGQTGYRGHPVLKTPNLDAMAANGLRLDRFYAGGPVCSPTRASVMTGRSPDRAAVYTHGNALRRQEKTIAQALSTAGYTTAHFGKWHLNGFKGAGVPILKDDPYSPGAFGFQHWTSTSNFFDLNPLLSHQGTITEHRGDSSEIIVDQAVQFLKAKQNGGKPLFAVIWYGTPHSPFRALPADKAQFANLDAASANHYGELGAMDRSIGTLRKSLRELGIADNTLVVFCSDNGGLANIASGTVGNLRGHKGDLYEGGIRVPGIIEWPAVIKPRVTQHPACTMDLFLTVAEIVGLPASAMITPQDGVSLKPLFEKEIGPREKPIPFRFQKQTALVENQYKLVTMNRRGGEYSLYDLNTDPKEQNDLREKLPGVYDSMRERLNAFNRSVDSSLAGQDYPEKRVTPADPRSVFWFQQPQYQQFLKEHRGRPEYQSIEGSGESVKLKKRHVRHRQAVRTSSELKCPSSNSCRHPYSPRFNSVWTKPFAPNRGAC
ncbi:MAG: sulfatase-like hydrolase/transferase [Planctomycetota bacterium]|nr:sulfatase-like hydrolase/transferase [Planctomycetota bacterium]